MFHAVQLDLLDNVGAPVINNVFGLLLDTPANSNFSFGPFVRSTTHLAFAHRELESI